MFGFGKNEKEKEKLKREIEKKAGTYTFGYDIPEGMKKNLKKTAKDMNKFLGKDIIHIDDDDD